MIVLGLVLFVVFVRFFLFVLFVLFGLFVVVVAVGLQRRIAFAARVLELSCASGKLAFVAGLLPFQDRCPRVRMSALDRKAVAAAKQAVLEALLLGPVLVPAQDLDRGHGVGPAQLQL